MAQKQLFSIAMMLTGVYGQTIASPPPQSAFTPPPSAAGNNALPPVSYSYEYTYTTPTTAWKAPTFATSVPLPACSDTMCPSLNGKQCQDAMGSVWGIICDARLSGLVITTSGKHKEIKHKRVDSQKGLDEAALELEERAAGGGGVEKRTFTGDFQGCAGYCDMTSTTLCVGVSFNAGYNGNCQAYDEIDGQFASPGGIAGIRVSAGSSGMDGMGGMAS